MNKIEAVIQCDIARKCTKFHECFFPSAFTRTLDLLTLIDNVFKQMTRLLSKLGSFRKSAGLQGRFIILLCTNPWCY